VIAEPALVTELPSGYERRRERGADVVALPSVMPVVLDALRSHGTLYDWASAQTGARSFTGRGSAYAVETAGDALVVRRYRRGGLVARVLHDRYVRFGETRPLVELRASVEARARGVATPEVVAAAMYPGAALYRADLATRLVPDAADLAETVLDGSRDSAFRIAAWRAAGSLLRRAFDAGVVHADLPMRNILVQRRADGVTAHLLDLDRAVVRAHGEDDVPRRRMLARLHRSRAKLETAYGVRVPPDELAAFEEAVRV
jgi:3-deoxy-D-manno-octulosonic acid kinase